MFRDTGRRVHRPGHKHLKMKKSERFDAVIRWFGETMPAAQSELVFRNPYELLVAVILSAQCTDRRVNMTTPAIFEKYPTPQAMSAASPEDIFPLIRSISYPNSKASHLAGMAKILVERFNGEVPSDIDELMSMPGVGRKTANVIASIIYDKPVIAVDTHVFRVAHRLGLSKGKTPLAVETDLEKGIPAELRAKSHHWLILHGRYTCTSLRPKCSICGLRDVCTYKGDSK